MGACFTSMKKQKYKTTVAVLGLENSGKTTVIKALKGEPLDEVVPTVGFRSDTLESRLSSVTLYDLGGGPRIRDIWKNYLPEVWGVVYVVDAGDRPKLPESKEVFHKLLNNPLVKQKPVLLLLNKQDKEGAIDEVQALDHLQLKHIVNLNKCPCRVEICTASKGTGKSCDSAIRAGFHWLIEQMDTEKSFIENQVTQDTLTAKELLKNERLKRAERVRKMKEEEEEEEEEKATKLEQDGHGSNSNDGGLITDQDDQTMRHAKSSHLTNGRSKKLPFEPLPGIEEERASQASGTHSRQGSIKRKADPPGQEGTPVALHEHTYDAASSSSSALASSYDQNNFTQTLKEARPGSGELRVTSLGMTADSNKLPPISSTSKATSEFTSYKPMLSQSPPSYSESLQRHSSNEEPGKVLSVTTSMPMITEVNASRKRRRRRLQRINKTAPLGVESDESHANSPRKTFIPPISLDKLPSSGPNDSPVTSSKGTAAEDSTGSSPKPQTYKPRIIPYEEDIKLGEKWHLAEEIM